MNKLLYSEHSHLDILCLYIKEFAKASEETWMLMGVCEDPTCFLFYKQWFSHFYSFYNARLWSRCTYSLFLISFFFHICIFLYPPPNQNWNNGPRAIGIILVVCCVNDNKWVCLFFHLPLHVVPFYTLFRTNLISLEVRKCIGIHLICL